MAIGFHSVTLLPCQDVESLSYYRFGRQLTVPRKKCFDVHSRRSLDCVFRLPLRKQGATLRSISL